MEGKARGQNLIWVLLLFGQIYGCKSCIQQERVGLLELKKLLISIYEEEGFDDVLPTWTNDTKSNCCRWELVKCNRNSKRVMELSLPRYGLSKSYLLNLSLLHPFEEVRSLDLSMYKFNGMFDDMEGYNSLKRLRNLEILDLSFNEFNNSIFPFLNVATSLTTLSLQENYLDGPLPIKELKNLTNLERLDLSWNRFNGSIKAGESPNLKKLKALYLNVNGFSNSMELQELKSFTNLEALNLASNSINETVLRDVVCEMKNLRELDLSGNYFVDGLPLRFCSLNKLRSLELSYNQKRFSENLPSSFSGLESLEYLSLSDNNFTGLTSLSPLANLTKLKVLRLSSSDVLQIEIESTWQPNFQLRVVELSFCSLEKIPHFLTYQKNLRLVDLSNNRLSGNIPTWLLENNPQLEVLLLRKNSFTTFPVSTLVHKLQLLDFSRNDINGVLPDNIGHMLPNLLHMNGSDNQLQGNLPLSMGEMKNILFMDLSYNNFSGELPKSLFTSCVSLRNLLLSHNKLTGHIFPRETSITSLKVLKMDNNLFTGKIGDGGLSLVDLSVIDMSNNFLTGPIPNWISDLTFLIILLISNNRLEGMLPPSLLAKPHLNFLDLSGNLLYGLLPSNVSSMYGIKMFLDDNNLTGPIPSNLLENAKILDLQNNKLSGSIPQFVNTGKLSILLLRGNNLTGSIPRKLCNLSSLRVLDLSHNKLSGFIPSCLNNLSFGLGGEEHLMSDYSTDIGFDGVTSWKYYKSTFFAVEFVIGYSTYLSVEIKFASKHRFDFYSGASDFQGGTLDFMYGLDLSSNELSGGIPTELGDLATLRALNLSHNFLSSSIPDSFSRLKDIESLDLSYNMLHGSIPHHLTNLTSLAVFNVSYNNLSGIIPQGVQFNTFDEDSYLGNPLLCGPPTDKSCETKKSKEEGDNVGEEEDDDEDVIDMLIFYWTIGSTYVIALMGFLLLMCFDCPWRRAWLQLVDAFIASAKNLCS